MGLSGNEAMTAKEAAEAVRGWLDHLRGERRLAAATLEAYERDLRQFFSFIAEHGGGPVTLKGLAELRPADIRAFLAHRRNEGAGGRSVARGLAGLRSFLRHLERQGRGSSAAAYAVRPPRKPHGLPKPIAPAKALALAEDLPSHAQAVTIRRER